MTPATLYPPIAAATIVNVLLFALMWRGTQIERRRGELPWPYLLGLLVYIAAIGGFMYLRLSAPVRGWGDQFGAAVMGEAMGAAIVYAILHAFLLSRGQPVRQRAFPMFLAIILTAGMFAGLFART